MEIKPFRGWRYSTSDGDVSKLIAPPYDILSAADKDALLAASEQNIVAVDLPHVPPKQAGPDSSYQAAAALLNQWKQQAVLKQDAAPAIYAYEQAFEWAGKSYCRRAILCGLRATAFGKDVIPHEQTFAGPKADRLKLMHATATQLSPIFGFYDDAGGRVTQAVFSGLCCPPQFGTLRGVGERLWPITDAATIAKVSALLKSTPVFIADGHHRYTTAMIYRDELAAAAGRALPADHEANFVMFALVARNDPGLLILPTHRMVKGLRATFKLADLVAALPQFSWRQVDLAVADLGDADSFLQPFGPSAMLLIDRGGRAAYVGRLTDAEAMKAAAPDKIDAWRQLDVSILQKLVIEGPLKRFASGELNVEYTPDGQAVLAACRGGEIDLGICLQSTPLSAVEAIASGGAFMPHKSTYFYPKLATGMVLKPL